MNLKIFLLVCFVTFHVKASNSNRLNEELISFNIEKESTEDTISIQNNNRENYNINQNNNLGDVIKDHKCPHDECPEDPLPEQLCEKCMREYTLKPYGNWKDDVADIGAEILLLAVSLIYMIPTFTSFIMPDELQNCSPVWTYPMNTSEAMTINFWCNFRFYTLEMRFLLLAAFVFSFFSCTVNDVFLRPWIELVYQPGMFKGMADLQKRLIYKLRSFKSKDGNHWVHHDTTWKTALDFQKGLNPRILALRAFYIARVLGVQAPWYLIYAFLNSIFSPLHSQFWFYTRLPIDIFEVTGALMKELKDQNPQSKILKCWDSDKCQKANKFFMEFLDGYFYKKGPYKIVLILNELLMSMWDLIVEKIQGYSETFLPERDLKMTWTIFFQTIGNIIEFVPLGYALLTFTLISRMHYPLLFFSWFFLNYYNMLKDKERSVLMKYWFVTIIPLVLMFYNISYLTFNNTFVIGILYRSFYAMIRLRSPWTSDVEQYCTYPLEFSGEYGKWPYHFGEAYKQSDCNIFALPPSNFGWAIYQFIIVVWGQMSILGVWDKSGIMTSLAPNGATWSDILVVGLTATATYCVYLGLVGIFGTADFDPYYFGFYILLTIGIRVLHMTYKYAQEIFKP